MTKISITKIKNPCFDYLNLKHSDLFQHFDIRISDLIYMGIRLALVPTRYGPKYIFVILSAAKDLALRFFVAVLLRMTNLILDIGVTRINRIPMLI
ncbi:MAG: hypothetical protein A3C47_04450 [Omnitrophica bacterium RIFCSPHIGHO2_02_FULL_51_18]|nr:MAG: hypothetical protein A3C47_04450 [Omnitrophica bacterium RIFCSPHIGHO2_02_FULL_51_18]